MLQLLHKIIKILKETTKEHWNISIIVKTYIFHHSKNTGKSLKKKNNTTIAVNILFVPYKTKQLHKNKYCIKIQI